MCVLLTNYIINNYYSLLSRYKVLRYPQLHIFRKGYQFEYNGPKEDR